MTHDNWRELVTDLQLENQELRSQLEETRRQLLEEQRERVDAKMSLRFAQEKLRGAGEAAVPVIDDGRAECGECCCELRDWWQFCPGCGKLIDWESTEEVSRP